VGVEVEQRGKREIVSCKRLVLSAGAVSTPGVLLRSGIGPRAELERLGVAQQVELPAVGARLLDHAGTAVFFRPKWGVMHFADPLVQTVFRFTSRNSKIPNDMQIQPGSHVPLPWFSLPMVTLAVCVGKPFGHGRLRFHSLDPRAKVGMEMHFFVKPE